MLIALIISLQVFIFVGLIFMFRHITTENVVRATKHLEQLSQDYDKKEKEINQRLQEAKQKSEELLSKARDEAETKKGQIIKEVEAERDKILKQARVRSDEIICQADRSREVLLSELHQRIEKGTISKACELIQDILPEQFKRDVHSHWIDELIGNGFSRLENLPIPEEIKEAKITSAFPLNEQQRKNLTKKLNVLLGHGIALKEEVDSQIVAGVIVTIGSLVLDGGLKNRIQEQAKDFDARVKTSALSK